jgi:hypothetical protein
MSDVAYRQVETGEVLQDADIRVMEEVPAEPERFHPDATITEADLRYGADDMREDRRQRGEPTINDPMRYPVVERRVANEDEPIVGLKGLKDASSQLSREHRKEYGLHWLTKAKAVTGNRTPSTPEEGLRFAETMMDYGDRIGQPFKPSEDLWDTVKLVTDDGKILPPLGKRVTEDDALNAREAARLTGNWREAQEQVQQELAARYRAANAQQDAVEQAQAARIAQAQQVQQAQRAAAQQHQQAEASIAAQRFVLQHQAAALQVSTEEKGIRNNWIKWLNYLKKECPEATNQQSWNWTAANNPARAQEIQKKFEKARGVAAASVKRIGELNEIRNGRARQWHETMGRAYAAQRAQYNQWADSGFKGWLDRTYPDIARDDRKIGQLQRAANEIMRETGMSEAQITHEWNFGQLRSPPAQQMLTHAAYARMMQRSAQSLRNHRQRIPQPQAPGNWQPAGNDYAEDISKLERQLQTQSGRAALTTATKLTQAKRRANRL